MVTEFLSVRKCCCGNVFSLPLVPEDLNKFIYLKIQDKRVSFITSIYLYINFIYTFFN